MPVPDVRLFAPILPTKIIGIGRNYAAHAEEMGGEAPVHPIMFLKPSTTVVGPHVPIRLPADSQRVDYEGELAMVIGKRPRGRHGRADRGDPGPYPVNVTPRVADAPHGTLCGFGTPRSA